MLPQPLPYSNNAVVTAKRVVNLVLNEAGCSNNCVFCFGRPQGTIQRNVTREIEKLRLIVNNMQVDAVEISGNDPGEYEGLADLVRSVRNLAAQAEIRLLTHGRTLATAEKVRELSDAGLSKYVIPIYGPSAEIHDAVTRRPGSFDQTLRGVRRVIGDGYKCEITCLITRENQQHLDALLALICELDSQATVGIPHLVDNSFLSSAPDLAALAIDLPTALWRLLQTVDARPWLRDLPDCLIGFPYPFIDDSRAPQFGYSHLEQLAPASKLDPAAGLPSYRLMGKAARCSQCSSNASCRGIYRSYIDANLFDPQPHGAV